MASVTRWLRAGAWLVAALTLAGCLQGSAEDDAPADVPPSISADIVQLRRDQVLERVEVAVDNHGPHDLLVEELHLVVPGFRIDRIVDEFGPIPTGQVVNLPVPYQGVDCPKSGSPRVGRPRLVMQVHAVDDTSTRRVRLPARDGDGLMQRIATRACAIEQVSHQVDLRFDDHWRLERGPEGKVLHGQLRARLRAGEAREVTQVAGAVMYGLRPDESAGPALAPLASLTARDPEAMIPVVAYAARCDGHTIGEIKKPFEFLVWVTAPGEEDIAVTPVVGLATKQALRKVCAF